MAMQQTGNISGVGKAKRLGKGGALKKGLMATAGTLLIAGCIQTVVAQSYPHVHDSTVLSGEALSGVSGISTTNMAAGNGNLQSNSGTLAIGHVANSANELQQQARIDEQLVNRSGTTSIKGHAFRQAKGWLSINQAAGSGNAQSNSFGVAMGISASNLSDTTLQEVQADRQGLKGTGDRSGHSSKRVEIEKDAFEGTRGVVQVNQAAGKGNVTRNSFRMNMALKP